MRSTARLLPLLLLAGCPQSPAPPPPPPPPGANETTTPEPAPPPSLPHAWPPTVGEPFPELVLLDDAGATMALTGLRGKVLLVHPVAVNDPACQDLSAIDGMLQAGGVDPLHPDLALVYLLLLDADRETPGVADARAWVEHHQLRQRAGAFVLVGDERYAAHPETPDLIGAMFAVDGAGTVVASASASPLPQERATLVGAIRPLLGPSSGKRPAPASASGFPDPESFPEAKVRAQIAEAKPFLPARRWKELDAYFDAVRAAGRLEDSFNCKVEFLPGHILTGDDEQNRQLVDEWVEASPQSAWARAVRADLYVDWAWEARGSGYAHTVSEEGWKLFGERLEQAAADVEAALRLDPRCEIALISRMTLAFGLGVDASTAAKWFEPVRAMKPPLVQAWRGYLNYLMPKWHGDEEGRQMWALARGAVKAHPDEAAFQLLILDAHEEMQRADRQWLRSHIAEIRKAIEIATTGYPRCAIVWRETCWVAQRAGDLPLWRKGLELAAELGDSKSQEWLALRLADGRDGFKADPARARLLYWRAANSGRPSSQAMIGLAYLEGDGVAQDPAEAIRWLKRGAASGEMTAVLAMGECYERGTGVPRDLQQALDWYRKALEARNETVREHAADKVADLQRALRARGAEKRKHPDGFDDWYPDDVTPPRGTSYPCPLKGLPRDLSGIPAGDRCYVNHVTSLLLQAIHARLRVWFALAQNSALDRYRTETKELRAAIAAEPTPAGLEPFRDDLLAALDGQLVFHQKVVQGVLTEVSRMQALSPAEQERRFPEILRRLAVSIPEGKQASNRLRAAWAKLEARWGKTWRPAVKDSLFHHLCALDVF